MKNDREITIGKMKIGKITIDEIATGEITTGETKRFAQLAALLSVAPLDLALLPLGVTNWMIEE